MISNNHWTVISRTPLSGRRHRWSPWTSAGPGFSEQRSGQARPCASACRSRPSRAWSRPRRAPSRANLLDRHDAPRLLSLARGDKATVRLATLFQMTFSGAPCVYCGDEIALRGTKAYDKPHRDRDARWPFPWDDRSRWPNPKRSKGPRSRSTARLAGPLSMMTLSCSGNKCRFARLLVMVLPFRADDQMPCVQILAAAF